MKFLHIINEMERARLTARVILAENLARIPSNSSFPPLGADCWLLPLVGRRDGLDALGYDGVHLLTNLLAYSK